MRVLLAALGLVVLLSLATSVTQVQPGELAVVRRFGKILLEKPGPGLHIGLPWGMDRVDRIPVELVRTVMVGVSLAANEDETVPQGQLLTGDHNLVNVQAEIHYKVIENEVANFVLQQDRVDGLIARAAEAALAEWAAKGKVEVILLTGKRFLPAWLVPTLQEIIEPYHLGVRIQQASITQLTPPAEVKPSFDEVGQEQARIATKINQALQEKDRKLREGEGEKFRLESLAKAYAREQHLAASAEAENFRKRLDQYRQLARTNPDYLNSMWTDSMTRLFSRMKETGRLDVLDNYLSAEGLNITQFPLLPRKK